MDEKSRRASRTLRTATHASVNMHHTYLTHRKTRRFGDAIQGGRSLICLAESYRTCRGAVSSGHSAPQLRSGRPFTLVSLSSPEFKVWEIQKHRWIPRVLRRTLPCLPRIIEPHGSGAKEMGWNLARSIQKQPKIRDALVPYEFVPVAVGFGAMVGCMGFLFP